MTEQEILEEIQSKPTVPVWPHLGWVDRRSRAATYAAVNAGEYEGIVIRVGNNFRAITSVLRQRRGIETA